MKKTIQVMVGWGPDDENHALQKHGKGPYIRRVINTNID